MNPWRRGPLTRNPYHRTPFRVARVPREITRRRTMLQLINQTENLLGKGHDIDNEPVSQAELNAMTQILLDARQRIVAELLEHATEKPPLERVRKLAREVAMAMTPEPEVAPLPITNLRVLDLWAQHLAHQFLDQMPMPDPSFGATELMLVPPFGHDRS